MSGRRKSTGTTRTPDRSTRRSTGRRSLVAPLPPASSSRLRDAGADTSAVSSTASETRDEDALLETPGRPAAEFVGEDATSQSVRPRRSLSQPPPNSVIRRQLRAAIGGTPARPGAGAGQLPTASTPRRQLHGAETPGTTPRRGRPGANAQTPGSASVAGPSALASEARRRRLERESMLADRSMLANQSAGRGALGAEISGRDALMALSNAPGAASTQGATPGSRMRRATAGRQSRIRGIAGWGGGRVESPFDLLSKLARAPGFYVPHTDESILQERVRQQPSLAKDLLRTQMQESSRRASGGSDSGAGGASSSRRSGNRSSVLQPGESVPGELTRDESDMDLIDDDGSFTRRTIPQSELGDDSEAGQGRRVRRPTVLASQLGGKLGELFNTPDRAGVSALGKQAPTSLSRRSLAGDLSGASGGIADMRNLDRTVDMDMTNVYGADEGIMSKLADVTRSSIFGPVSGRESVGSRRLDEGELSVDQQEAADAEEEDVFNDAGVGVRSARAMSEPLGAEVQDMSFGVPFDDMPALDHYPDDESLAEQEAAAAAAAGDVTAMGDMTERADTTARPDDDTVGEEGGLQDDGYETMTESEDDDSEPHVTRVKSKSRVLLKQRLVRKKKIRISPHTGQEVPALPTSLTKGLFQSFVTPASSASAKGGKYKIEKAALDAVEDASHAFFAQFAQEISAQAEASGRSSTINEADVIAVMKDHGHITARNPLASVARKLLPRELSDLMSMTLSASEGKKRKREEPSKASDYIRSAHPEKAKTTADTSKPAKGKGKAVASASSSKVGSSSKKARR